jgi:hypothetical protein
MTSEPLKGASGIAPLLSFPHPVNEYGSRTIAGLTFALAGLTIVAQWPWLTVLLVYLFAAGVVAGPKLTPTGWLTTKVLLPYVIKRKRPTAGPPKQFAQGVGLVLSVAAAVLALVFGLNGIAYGVLGVLVFFSGLEAFVGFCAGCFVFGYLMRWGLIPAELCQRCNDLNFGPLKPAEAGSES